MVNKTPETGLSIDLDKPSGADNTLIELNINGVMLKAPRKHIGNDTAVAGKINDKGVITFSRCKPENKGNYSVLDTPQGKLTFGGKFQESLKGRVK